MRQFLTYTPDQGSITVTPSFNVKLLAGTFTLSVWDKNGNEIFSKREEVATDLEPIALPNHTEDNDMFMVELNATITSLNTPEDGQKYEMTLTTKQSDKALGDPAKAEGPLPDDYKVITIIVVLNPTKATTA